MIGKVLRRLSLAAAAVVICAALSGHLGSPDTIWEGRAGAWPVRVIIRDPGVIPGQAEVIVRSAAPGVTSVAVTSAIWNADGASPPPDIASRIPGDSTLWSTHIWFMRASSYAVRVQIEGTRGQGEAVIPFVARATRVTPLPVSLAITLGVLGLLLTAGLVTIVTAAVGESSSPSGEAAPPARIRRARHGGFLTVALLLLLFWLGNSWWNSEADAYARGVLEAQPFRASTHLEQEGATATISLEIVDTAWQGRNQRSEAARRRGLWTPLIPDHGKLMHAFLVSENGDGFAHLHPVSQDSTRFTAVLPPLPAGRYRLFADIVHESGWSQTLTATVDLPAGITAWSVTDQDDAMTIATATADTLVHLADGITVTRTGGFRLERDTDLMLGFRVLAPDGSIARVEPYLGMAGHLVLVMDSTIYLHLHPGGTSSVAAAAVLSERLKLPASTEMTHDELLSERLTFPYRFPREGAYRVWLQFRYQGRIHTAPFIVNVANRWVE